MPRENPSKPSSPSSLKIRTTSQRPSVRLSQEDSHIRHKTAIDTLISALVLTDSLSISAIWRGVQMEGGSCWVGLFICEMRCLCRNHFSQVHAVCSSFSYWCWCNNWLWDVLFWLQEPTFFFSFTYFFNKPKCAHQKKKLIKLHWLPIASNSRLMFANNHWLFTTILKLTTSDLWNFLSGSYI